MDNQETQKTHKASKSFMAIGPTLHYSHQNVQRCWLLALAAFALSCLFWSKIVVGTFVSFDFQTLVSPELWHLGRFAVGGVSIFEYPWQILVLGLLMGVLAVAPVLVSQLMSFVYCIPFLLALILLGNLPGFAVFILLSCVAVACRPLRFRSRFTAIALCTAPQLLYWGCFGGADVADPIEFGFSFTPWICAWLAGLAMAGLVLGIGHYTRYRPGLVWTFTCVLLLSAIATFEMRIGFDELDYQLYVAENAPEDIGEFQNHSITEALDEQITRPTFRLKKHVESGFYSTDQIELRKELKKEIQIQLSYDLWPWWFTVPPGLNYQPKKKWLFEQYDSFISRRGQSRRMPIALYYKALLGESSVDIKVLGEKEVVHFYSDYPFDRSQDAWRWLYTEFGDSPESIEARWRIAKHWAGQDRFEQADKLIKEAQTMIAERLELLAKEQPQDDTIFSPFHPPAESGMTPFKLTELQKRINQLHKLISSENRTDDPATAKRLAEFVMLNPHSQDYSWQLDGLLSGMGPKDPLRDNILLAKTGFVADNHLRAEQLKALHNEFKDTDGGMQALYELALLKISLYQAETDAEQKKKYLVDARTTLTSFIESYPKSFCTDRVKKNLEALPTPD